MRSPHTFFSSAGASRTGAAAGRRPLGAVLATLTLLAALLAALVPAVRADAVPAGPAVQPQAAIDPDATTSIQVHKFAQPEQLGEPSSGLEQDTTGLTPVAGATFTATKVPGIDTTTDAGRQAAADLSVAEAIAAIGSAAPAATETTDAAGDAPLTGLGVALYLVQETFTPTGYVASDPFLVLLPLTNPGTGDNWLYTVHVYPKNAHVTATIDVDDAAAVSAADAVRWTSHTTIPRRTSITAYVVRNLVDTRLTLLDSAAQVQVSLACTGCAAGLDAADFTTAIVTYDGHETVEVTFSEAGRAKLATARAADPDATVDVSYRTAVDTAVDTVAEVNGTFVNEVRLFPDVNTLEGRGTAASDATSTKFGPLEIIVHEKGNDANRIPGARFQLFLTAEDAANRTNAVTVWGDSEWTTDTDGVIVIDGLRFSDFVNGLDRDPADPLYRTYYIRMIEVPAGWEGTTDPIGLVVNSSAEAQVAVVELHRAVEDASGLALTGGQIAGVWVIGAVLVALGLLALLARRRRRDDSSPGSAEGADAAADAGSAEGAGEGDER